MQAKGGSFEGNDKDFLRIQYGKAQLIPGVQLGLAGMKVGGIRRLIIPETLGYPNADFRNWGPSPETFAVSSFQACSCFVCPGMIARIDALQSLCLA